VDVAIKVCFADFHDVTVPPCRNTNPIRDLVFYCRRAARWKKTTSNVLASVDVLNDQLLFIAKRP
jgi:hypothetical protein